MPTPRIPSFSHPHLLRISFGPPSPSLSARGIPFNWFNPGVLHDLVPSRQHAAQHAAQFATCARREVGVVHTPLRCLRRQVCSGHQSTLVPASLTSLESSPRETAWKTRTDVSTPRPLWIRWCEDELLVYSDRPTKSCPDRWAAKQPDQGSGHLHLLLHPGKDHHDHGLPWEFGSLRVFITHRSLPRRRYHRELMGSRGPCQWLGGIRRYGDLPCDRE